MPLGDTITAVYKGSSAVQRIYRGTSLILGTEGGGGFSWADLGTRVLHVSPESTLTGSNINSIDGIAGVLTAVNAAARTRTINGLQAWDFVPASFTYYTCAQVTPGNAGTALAVLQSDSAAAGQYLFGTGTYPAAGVYALWNTNPLGWRARVTDGTTTIQPVTGDPGMTNAFILSYRYSRNPTTGATTVQIRRNNIADTFSDGSNTLAASMGAGQLQLGRHGGGLYVDCALAEFIWFNSDIGATNAAVGIQQLASKYAVAL